MLGLLHQCGENTFNLTFESNLSAGEISGSKVSYYYSKQFFSSLTFDRYNIEWFD